jgi:hypothetical protein
MATAYNELQNRDVATLLTLSLSRGALGGVPGSLDTDKLSTSELDDAISMCEDVVREGSVEHSSVSIETRR